MTNEMLMSIFPWNGQSTLIIRGNILLGIVYNENLNSESLAPGQLCIYGSANGDYNKFFRNPQALDRIHVYCRRGTNDVELIGYFAPSFPPPDASCNPESENGQLVGVIKLGY